MIRKRDLWLPKQHALQKERRHKMFIMHAFRGKADGSAIYARARRTVVQGYRNAVKLENRQIRSKHSLSMCWLGYEIPESVSFRSNREGLARTARNNKRNRKGCCLVTLHNVPGYQIGPGKASSCGGEWPIYHQELPPGPEGLP